MITVVDLTLATTGTLVAGRTTRRLLRFVKIQNKKIKRTTTTKMIGMVTPVLIDVTLEDVVGVEDGEEVEVAAKLLNSNSHQTIIIIYISGVGSNFSMGGGL